MAPLAQLSWTPGSPGAAGHHTMQCLLGLCTAAVLLEGRGSLGERAASELEALICITAGIVHHLCSVAVNDSFIPFPSLLAVISRIYALISVPVTCDGALFSMSYHQLTCPIKHGDWSCCFIYLHL